MCGMMIWDRKLSNHTFRLLFKHLSLFGHTVWVSDESDVKQIWTASPWRTEGDYRDAPILCGWRLPSRTWNQWTSPSMKQLTWLRIVHSGDWCLLRTHSGACQKWMNEWIQYVMQWHPHIKIKQLNWVNNSYDNLLDSLHYLICHPSYT